MSSSNTSAAEIAAINYSSVMFVEYYSYLLICLGTVGHSLNIYVFTRPTLRSNPCVRYFLAATLSGIFVTYINVLLRLIQVAYNFDAFGKSLASCKILTFVLFWAKSLTSWFIALASVDRFLCSSRSVTMRAWSNVRVASRIIPLMIIAVGLIYIYVPIQYVLKPAFWKCPSNQGSYPAFNGIYNLFAFSLGPPIVMLIFGSLTILHIQRSVRRMNPQNVQTQSQAEPPPQEQLRRQKTTDRQLIQMMFVQCVYFSMMSIPISVYWIDTSARINVVVTDALQNAKHDLFANVAGTLSFTGACTSFYLFTLSSQLFRRELMHLFKGRGRQNPETTIRGMPRTGTN